MQPHVWPEQRSSHVRSAFSMATHRIGGSGILTRHIGQSGCGSESWHSRQTMWPELHCSTWADGGDQHTEHWNDSGSIEQMKPYLRRSEEAARPTSLGARWRQILERARAWLGSIFQSLLCSSTRKSSPILHTITCTHCLLPGSVELDAEIAHVLEQVRPNQGPRVEAQGKPLRDDLHPEGLERVVPVAFLRRLLDRLGRPVGE